MDVYRVAEGKKTKKEKRRAADRRLWLDFLLFGLIFDVPALNIGFFSLRRLILLIALCTALKRGLLRKPAVNRAEIFLTMQLIVLTLYGFYVVSANSMNLSINKAVYSRMYIPILWMWVAGFPILYSFLYCGKDEFFNSMSDIMVFQSAFVILIRLCPALHAWGIGTLSEIEVIGDFATGGRRVYMIGTVASEGSLYLLLGCICCFYFLVKRRGKARNPYLIKYVFIMLATAFVGRTGLYMEMALLFLYALIALVNDPKTFFKIVCLSAAAAGVLAAYYYVINDLGTLVYWIGEIFTKITGENSNLSILANMDRVPFCRETFWGTGLYRGITASGIAVDTDVGYMQNYFALGFFGASLYYGSLFAYYFNAAFHRKAYIRYVLLIFLLLFITAELKARYFTNAYLFFASMIIGMDSKERRARRPDRETFLNTGKILGEAGSHYV